MPPITLRDIISTIAALVGVFQGCNLSPIEQDPNRFATSIAVSQHVIDPGTEVQFTGIANYTGETPAQWTWSLGNGQTASGPTASAVYNASGLYDVTLTVTCESGTIFTRTEKNLVCVRDLSLPSGLEAGEEVLLAGIVFVWIPPGTFLQGDTAGTGETDEVPQHAVTLTHGFWMSKYELTQAQWEAVVFRQPSWFATDTGDSPVERISWDDAQQFLKYLTDISPGTFRLPTEAEWEYACRAGSQTEWFFSETSEELPQYAWHADNAGNTTHPVGGLEPNAWGLYDINGNVDEWVHDYYINNAYETASDTDPLYQQAARFRGVRGGSWKSPIHQTRAAFRNFYVPSSRYNSIGMRVVCN